jgi:hypothetical protein
MEARPLSTTLGEKQQLFADGPSNMSYFICKSCNNKFLDCNLYYNDVKSTTCLWCTKFPRRK